MVRREQYHRREKKKKKPTCRGLFVCLFVYINATSVTRTRSFRDGKQNNLYYEIFQHNNGKVLGSIIVNFESLLLWIHTIGFFDVIYFSCWTLCLSF
jgi:hypothetical protein